MIIDTNKDKFLLVSFLDNTFSALSVEGCSKDQVMGMITAIKSADYVYSGRSIYPNRSIVRFSFASSKMGATIMYDDVNEMLA